MRNHQTLQTSCSRLNFRKGSLAALALLCGLLLCGFAETPNLLSSAALGDEAFRSGNFDQAIKFYQDALAKANEPDARQEAYERLIAAYLRAQKTDEARRVLKEYETKMPQTGADRRLIYQADLLLMERKYAEAERILEKMLQRKAISGRLYFHLLASLGYAQRMQKKWDQAAATYAMLQKAGTGLEWEFVGYRNRALALIMGKEFGESTRLLAVADKYKDNPDFFDIEVLKFFQLIEEKKFGEVKTAYAKLRDRLPAGPHPILYNMQMNAAAYYLTHRAPGDAINFLRDAFESAPSALERRLAMRSLINAYYEAGNRRDAAATAVKYLDFYADAPDAVEVRMKVSRLYTELKNYDEARNVLKEVMTNQQVPIANRLAAARQAAAICEAQNDYQAAAGLLQFVRDNSPSIDQREEGSYLLGMVYLKSGNAQKALETFRDSTNVASAWQTRCRLGVMKALMELKNYPEALAIGRQIIQTKSAPDIQESAYYYQGYILNLMKQPLEAAKAYRLFVDKFPKSQFAPDALIEGGNLYFANRKYAEAKALLNDFIRHYPKHENAPAALYKCLYADFLTDRPQDALKTTAKLEKNYPQSPYTPAAQFWKVDYLRNNRQLTEAAALLKQMAVAYREDSEIQGQILLDQAIIAELEQRGKEAIDLLEDFFNRFADSPRMAEALFLAGDIASFNGDYAGAASYYARCAQLRPGSRLAWAAHGRIGDCNFTLYNKTGDEKFLKNALNDFQNLLKEEKLDHNLRNQTLYKLGAAQERAQDDANALRSYHEVIYRYRLGQTHGLQLLPVWPVRAGYAAARIHLRRGTPEEAAEAIKIFQGLQTLKLKPGEDFQQMINNIKTKYKI